MSIDVHGTWQSQDIPMQSFWTFAFRLSAWPSEGTFEHQDKHNKDTQSDKIQVKIFYGSGGVQFNALNAV